MAVVRNFLFRFPQPPEDETLRTTGARRMTDDTGMSHRHAYVSRMKDSVFLSRESHAWRRHEIVEVIYD